MVYNSTMNRAGNYLMQLVLVVVLILGFSVLVKSQQPGLGLGIMFGEPTGLSFKGGISELSAIDGGLGWSFAYEGAVHIHVDYLYHFYNVFDTPKLPLCLGVGGGIKLKNTEHNSDMRPGVRIPFGISYQFTEIPVDIFLEIAPVLDLNPKTEGSVTEHWA